MDKPPYLVLRADDIEPFTHPEERGYHSQHVLGKEITGGHDLLLNRGTVDPEYDLGGGNHPENDEIYYAESGECLVDLGGHPDTGEGHETFTLGAGGVVFIPAGTFHRLRNRASEPFVVLTIWPQPAVVWCQRHPRRAPRDLGQRASAARRVCHRTGRWRRSRGRTGHDPLVG